MICRRRNETASISFRQMYLRKHLIITFQKNLYNNMIKIREKELRRVVVL